MKRIVITILVALCTIAAGGQNNGREVLDQMGQKMAQLGDYRIEFALEMPGAEEASKGYYVVSDERYIIDIEGMAQGFDGEAVWMLNHLVREVTLDSPKPDSRSLFDNPTKAFNFGEELFEVESVQSTADSKEWRLTLHPAEGVLDGIERVVVEVDKKSLLPTMLGYDMAGVGIYIEIVKIEPAHTTANDFRIAIPDGYEVIDFR